MIVTDKAGKEIPSSVADEIRGLREFVKDASFQIYGTAVVKGGAIEIIGAEPGKMTGYRVYGRLPKSADELMVGVNLKDLLKAAQGDKLRIEGPASEDFTVTAVFEKGSDEDSAIVIPLVGAQKLLAMTGVSAVLLNADTERLREGESEIQRRYPFLGVKTLRQVAVAEERVLGRIQLLMLMVTGVVLFSSVIALGSTMGANVIERMEEIGLMKSIGATQDDIRKFFATEAALAGLVGALSGFLAGVVAAEIVSKTAFGSFIPVNIFIAPFAVFLGVFIAVVATYLPVRDAMKVVPAQILRGE